MQRTSAQRPHTDHRAHEEDEGQEGKEGERTTFLSFSSCKFFSLCNTNSTRTTKSMMNKTWTNNTLNLQKQNTKDGVGSMCVIKHVSIKVHT